MKKRLGEILIERQLLTVEQLNTALVHQRQWSMRLGAALVAKGFITEGKLTQVLSEFLGIPMVDMAKVVVDQKAMELVPVMMCEQHDVFPISLKAQKGRRILVLAMADPLNFSARDELAFSTGCLVQPAIAQLSSLNQAVRRFYHHEKIEITPLDFERTPLSHTGRPVAPQANGRAPVELPAAQANWMNDLMRPTLGGPGKEPAPPPPMGGPHQPIPLTVRLGETYPPAPPPMRQQVPLGGPAGGGNQNWLGEEADAVMGVLEDTALPLVEVFSDEPTGTYAVAKRGSAPPPSAPVPNAVRMMGWEPTESLEERFWALVRALSARGLVTREEFLAQLNRKR
jgi:Type II secretion system (T2SS), protein E, N-terminal domain